MPTWNYSSAKRCASISGTSRDRAERWSVTNGFVMQPLPVANLRNSRRSRLPYNTRRTGCPLAVQPTWLCYKTEATTSVPHDSAGTGRGDLRSIGKLWHDLTQRRVDNRDLCAQSDHLVKFDDVIRPHPHATVTDRQSQGSFFRRSVNVDIAAEGIRVLRFPSAQPDNAANDRIAPGSIG